MIDFDKLISDYLKRDRKPKTIGRYYPSECGSCLRKAYYSYLIPTDIDDDLLKIFHVGDLLHTFIKDVFSSDKSKAVVELVDAEKPFTIEQEGYLIAGRIDDLLLLKTNGEQVLVEVKSTAYLSSSPEPSLSHILQLQLYLHATNIPKGILLYLEKNTLKTQHFTIPYDVALVQKALHRFKLLHNSLTTNTIPDPEARLFHTMRWMCGRCSYREQCYKQNPATPELP